MFSCLGNNLRCEKVKTYFTTESKNQWFYLQVITAVLLWILKKCELDVKKNSFVASYVVTGPNTEGNCDCFC